MTSNLFSDILIYVRFQLIFFPISRFGPEHIRSITVANMTKRVVTEFDLAFKKELEELK